MSSARFPSLPGLGWSVHKKPIFSTRVAKHVSGREVRAALYAYPLYEFDLTYELLRAGAEAELQTLMGFYLQRQGQYDTFLYQDPTDCEAVAQVLGTGDGRTTVFPFIRAFGGWVEPVGSVDAVSAVRVGGVTQPTGWSLQAPNALVFAAAPAVGVQVSADFSFSFLCRFLDDTHDYENFMNQLWSLKNCKLRSVKP
jgi:uncharacterized protein (TIGR02217 family)